jgi:predicted ribosome quality control (RQC) complex YloA/Tae2 family protein
MPLPPASVSQAALTLDPALDGARIQAVHQPDDATVVLEAHRAGAGSARWLCSVRPESARFGRTFVRATRGGRPPVFCQWLRTRLEGGRVLGLTRRHAQILDLAIAQGDAVHHLLLELNRRDSNLLLLDGEERLLIALRHPTLPDRKLSPGDAYRPPPRLHAWPGGVPLAERYPAPDEATARALERAWLEREAVAALDTRRRPALSLARRERKRLQRRLAKLEDDRAAAQEAERWKRRGELLQIHRGRLRTGMTAVEVPDVFEPHQPPVTIALDPQAEPGENIARCFRRYRKSLAAGPHVAQRMAESRAADAAWQDVTQRLEQAATPAALEALAAGLPPGLGSAAGELRRLLRGAVPLAPAARPAAAAGEQGREPMRRLSAEGYTMLVGRSAAENDRVTFRLAQGRDWWFHAQGIPGSHVVVLNPTGAALPPRTLREAAWLAGYYSQARASGRVEVDYAQRKHVRRIKGGEPGQVTYSQNKSVLVNLEDAELRQVLQREPPET